MSWRPIDQPVHDLLGTVGRSGERPPRTQQRLLDELDREAHAEIDRTRRQARSAARWFFTWRLPPPGPAALPSPLVDERGLHRRLRLPALVSLRRDPARPGESIIRA